MRARLVNEFHKTGDPLGSLGVGAVLEKRIAKIMKPLEEFAKEIPIPVEFFHETRKDDMIIVGFKFIRHYKSNVFKIIEKPGFRHPYKFIWTEYYKGEDDYFSEEFKTLEEAIDALKKFCTHKILDEI